jgi:hypothetical protein
VNIEVRACAHARTSTHHQPARARMADRIAVDETLRRRADEASRVYDKFFAPLLAAYVEGLSYAGPVKPERVAYLKTQRSFAGGFQFTLLNRVHDDVERVVRPAVSALNTAGAHSEASALRYALVAADDRRPLARLKLWTLMSERAFGMTIGSKTPSSVLCIALDVVPSFAVDAALLHV